MAQKADGVEGAPRALLVLCLVSLAQSTGWHITERSVQHSTERSVQHITERNVQVRLSHEVQLARPCRAL